MKLVTAHTSELDGATLESARSLLYDVFRDEMTEDDWEHSLGGIHALAWDGDELIGHASVIQRRLLHAGLAIRTGYVEGLGVRADRRREGTGGALMEALERVIRSAYELGGLAATDMALPFYASRGWIRWEGLTYALTPDGMRRTADADGSVFVLPVAAQMDPRREITCDWREGDPW